MRTKKIQQIDYCQFLLASQINYIQTYFADHSEEWSHDQINRYLRGEQITPRQVWENVREDLILSGNGYIVYDDTVADKRHSFRIEPVRKQWSGNEKKVIKEMGIVTCVYVNPEENAFWVHYKNHLMPLADKLLLRKRAIIESVIDQLKNTSQIEYSRHRSPVNFFVNVLAGLIAYCLQPKKPSLHLDNLDCLPALIHN